MKTLPPNPNALPSIKLRHCLVNATEEIAVGNTTEACEWIGAALDYLALVQDKPQQKLLIAQKEEFEREAQNLIRGGWRAIGPVMCNNMPRFDYYQTFTR